MNKENEFIFAVDKHDKIFLLDINKDSPMSDIFVKLQKEFQTNWENKNKIEYNPDQRDETNIFESKFETTEILNNFYDHISKKSEIRYLTKENIKNIKAICYYYNGYICIQKDRILSNLKSSVVFSNSKLEKVENIITIKDYFDGIIYQSDDKQNVIVWFKTPKNLILINVLNKHNPYKYNTKADFQTQIKTTAHLTKYININSSDNIHVGKDTKKKLNSLIDFDEEKFNNIINFLSSDDHKNKNYIVGNQLFFPKEKSEFKEFIKIIFTLRYQWENYNKKEQ
jgi:hypothetical protein